MIQGPRAIFSECSQPLWKDIVARLQDKHGWDIVYWVASPGLGAETKHIFPKTVFHHNIDAIKNLPPQAMRDLEPQPVDASILKALSPYESIVLNMMDRFESGNSFTFTERQELYHQYLSYWGAVLEKYNPQIAFFIVAPHVAYDYVLFLLCRLKGILTVMFDHTAILGRILLISDFEEGCQALNEEYEKLLIKKPSNIHLSPASEKHLADLAASYEKAMPFYFREFKEKLVSNKADKSTKSVLVKAIWPMHWLRSINSLISKYTQPAPLHYLKKPGLSLADSLWSGLAWQRYRKRKNARKQALEKYYNSLVKQVDFDEPYVVLALHYQPEQTTSPQGGMYVNQLMLARLLAYSMPKGWKLYIKEAIGQFAPYMKGEWSRSEYFYNEMASLPDTSLISMEYESFQLIDRAQAVATVTGTMGWEAIVRGKPALVFGHAWYRQCEGAFYTPDRESLEEAFKTIQQGFKVDAYKVRLFLLALERSGLWGVIYPKREKVEGLKADENVITLADAINKFYLKHCLSVY